MIFFLFMTLHLTIMSTKATTHRGKYDRFHEAGIARDEHDKFQQGVESYAQYRRLQGKGLQPGVDYHIHHGALLSTPAVGGKILAPHTDAQFENNEWRFNLHGKKKIPSNMRGGSIISDIFSSFM